MKYSDKLNGYWEEGYHYYIEIRDDRMTVRNYRRAVALETRISYDADLLESGARAVITPEETVLSRDAYGEPFTMIRELAWESGELKFLYYYTIMGETLYTLKKVDHGPFAHIIIRDDEFLPGLQGEWVEWNSRGRHRNRLTIDGDRLTMLGVDGVKIHVISYTYSQHRAYIVPANLIDTDFGSYTQIEVRGNMLTTRMMICDASSPLSVFAREDKVDSIPIPEEAGRPVVSNMTSPHYDPSTAQVITPPAGMLGSFFKQPGTQTASPEAAEKKTGPNFCTNCGYKLPPDHGRFCPECGSRLPES